MIVGKNGYQSLVIGNNIGDQVLVADNNSDW